MSVSVSATSFSYPLNAEAVAPPSVVEFSSYDQHQSVVAAKTEAVGGGEEEKEIRKKQRKKQRKKRKAMVKVKAGSHASKLQEKEKKKD